MYWWSGLRELINRRIRELINRLYSPTVPEETPEESPVLTIQAVDYEGKPLGKETPVYEDELIRGIEIGISEKEDEKYGVRRLPYNQGAVMMYKQDWEIRPVNKIVIRTCRGVKEIDKVVGKYKPSSKGDIEVTHPKQLCAKKMEDENVVVLSYCEESEVNPMSRRIGRTRMPLKPHERIEMGEGDIVYIRLPGMYVVYRVGGRDTDSLRPLLYVGTGWLKITYRGAIRR